MQGAHTFAIPTANRLPTRFEAVCPYWPPSARLHRHDYQLLRSGTSTGSPLPGLLSMGGLSPHFSILEILGLGVKDYVYFENICDLPHAFCVHIDRDVRRIRRPKIL